MRQDHWSCCVVGSGRDHAQDSVFAVDKILRDGGAPRVSSVDINAGGTAVCYHVARTNDVSRGVIVDLDTGIDIAYKSIEFNPNQVACNGMVVASFLDDDAISVATQQIALTQQSCAGTRVSADSIIMSILPECDGCSVKIDNMQTLNRDFLGIDTECAKGSSSSIQNNAGVAGVNRQVVLVEFRQRLDD